MSQVPSITSSPPALLQRLPVVGGGGVVVLFRSSGRIVKLKESMQGKIKVKARLSSKALSAH